MIWVLVAVEDGPYLIPLFEGILRLFDLLEFGGGSSAMVIGMPV